MSNIGYHTRLRLNHPVKTSGGSFGGSLDMKTINRLTRMLFSIKISAAGFPSFVDSSGREVSLYISVDPESTEIGREALAARREEDRLQRAREAARREELEALLDGMDTEEALRRLRGEEP